jgi:uncharacterized protein
LRTNPHKGREMATVTLDQARQYYRGADPAHDFDHVLRVLELAERIGRAEGADMDVLRAAVLLHDIGRREEIDSGVCHAQIGAEKARRILSDWPHEKVEAIAHAISTHRFRNENPPRTLEAKVLYDADKLDCIGAIGVVRAYVVGGMTGQRLWAEVDSDYLRGRESNKTLSRKDIPPDHTPVHEFAFKLSRIREVLFTPTAREIAEERHRFMAEFFARLDAEVRGEL